MRSVHLLEDKLQTTNAPLLKKRDMYQGKDAKVLKSRIKELKHE